MQLRIEYVFRDYLIKLLLNEGRGRQPLVMRTLKYMTEARLIAEHRLEPVVALLEELEQQICPGTSSQKGGAQINEPARYLLPSEAISRLRDCTLGILCAEQSEMVKSHAPSLTCQNLRLSDRYALDRLDYALLELIVRRRDNPCFAAFFDEICCSELTLYTACAAVLDTTHSDVFIRLQPTSSLCTHGLLTHLGEAGFSLDDVCRAV